MALPHKSVATIDDVEFVNLTPLDINPLMSKCEIKVFYLGQNRNGSFINKDTATEMAKTLRGAPIVGYYKQEKGDFADHGQKVTIDDEGVHFECKTQPYGFVAPDAEVWFKTFQEQDDFGQPIEREYLMTQGYLWTGQYEEANKIYEDGGKPHSMELDKDTFQGHWAKDSKTGIEYFIINDAIVSKLCILGDDVQPCFEGSSITAPEVSSSFTLDNNFKKTLYDMMKDLEFALKGGNTVSKVEEKAVEEAVKETPSEFSEQQQDNSIENGVGENQETTEEVTSPAEFEKKDDDQNKEQDDQTPAAGSEEESNTESESEEDDDKEKKPATKNSLHTDEEYAELEQKYTELETKFTALTAENEQLVEFKNKIEDQQKDELISKFYMLSDEDKKDVIENKRNYSLEDIEAKLAVIGYHKGVNFDLNSSSKNEKQTEDLYTVNVDDTTNALPAWVKAVDEVASTM